MGIMLVTDFLGADTVGGVLHLIALLPVVI